MELSEAIKQAVKAGRNPFDCSFIGAVADYHGFSQKPSATRHILDELCSNSTVDRIISQKGRNISRFEISQVIACLANQGYRGSLVADVLKALLIGTGCNIRHLNAPRRTPTFVVPMGARSSFFQRLYNTAKYWLLNEWPTKYIGGRLEIIRHGGRHKVVAHSTTDNDTITIWNKNHSKVYEAVWVGCAINLHTWERWNPKVKELYGPRDR